MKKVFLIVILFLSAELLFSQSKGTGIDVWYAKEFSKSAALFYSKEYLFKNILQASSELIKFEVIPLAAAGSGELTTLIYKCESKQKEGLILGFFGNYFNSNGLLYTGFSFKNLDRDQAIVFLKIIEQAMQTNNDYLLDDPDNNNIVFQFDDINILIWSNGTSNDIRLFWNGFDSSWGYDAFARSQRRFERKLSK